MRKTRQTSPVPCVASVSIVLFGVVIRGRRWGKGKGEDRPIKTRKKAKLALKAGVCSPAGLPGLPIWVAATFGSVM